MSDVELSNRKSGLLLLAGFILVPVLSTLASTAWYGFRSMYFPYGMELGLNYDELGLGLTLSSLAAPFGALVAAVVLAFVRARWVLAVGFFGLILCLSGIAIGSALGSSSTFLTSVYTLMPVGAMGRSFLSASLVSLAVLLVPELRDVRAMIVLAGLYLGLNLGGFVAAQGQGVVLSNALGVPMASVILSAVCLCLLGLGLLLALGYTSLGAFFSPPEHTEPFNKKSLVLSILALLLTLIPISGFWGWWGWAYVANFNISGPPDPAAPLLWVSSVAAIVTAVLLMMALAIASFVRVRLSPWWVFSVGALFWSLCCAVGLITGFPHVGQYDLSVWIVSILSGVGEVFVPVGLWAGLSQGQHWRAVGPLVGIALFGSLAGNTLLLWVVNKAPFMDSIPPVALTLICLVNVLICVGIGLAMVWLNRPVVEVAESVE